ncbi:GTP 3',8-cyclase MoaA [Agathobaculum sp.]|uniref:GTP 3',8-cyclase MoaA n=1 Tax=Agathobaculum sp. TaxID=2048138 RepID=UPI002A80CE4D|nr:GTP 3',8-cyclase MoaA [Agathobaculum sp.]MDY3619513.1 GTP 3',8-cyclase MoaA [Agathobaculum sp.]
MLDQFGREIDYLRLSVTERCNLRCIYCREGNDCFTAENELSAKEISRIVEQMVALGVRKVRVTGGEPLVRSDLEQIVADIARHPEVADLCMTTNAQGLENRVADLRCAGLGRLNISLDSLCKERYSKMTRGGHLGDVLGGIDAALACGMGLIKVNTVLVRGENDSEIGDFIRLAKEYPIDVRFIELMPIGRLGEDGTRRIPSAEVLEAYPELRPVAPRSPCQPSEDFAGEGFRGRVGFISPVSHKFCGVCNRVRLTSDGHLRMCLGDNAETDLRPALERSDEMLFETIREAVWKKPRGHHFETLFHSLRAMNRIGG